MQAPFAPDGDSGSEMSDETRAMDEDDDEDEDDGDGDDDDEGSDEDEEMMRDVPTPVTGMGTPDSKMSPVAKGPTTPDQGPWTLTREETRYFDAGMSSDWKRVMFD